MKKNNCYDRGMKIPAITKLLMIMKLTVFFLIISSFTILANKTYSQTKKIDLNMKDASVKEVLSKIEDLSGYNFMYSEKLIDVERKISIDVNNLNVEEVLNWIFEGRSISIKQIDRIIVLSQIQDSQEKGSGRQKIDVSGKVTDSKGSPLPGVTVVVKGTTNGVITDSNGNYLISNISEDAILIYSFVGMQGQEVSVNGKTVLDIVLEVETKGIDEVIVIGYGTQKKSNLTAAVEMVDMKAIENRPVHTIGEMLEGTVPNLNITINSGAPDATPEFNIRGFTGFNNNVASSAQPLILVDGVEQDINLISPNDVESVSVLKDAAASAIYGSRAPHGVILIKTKSGKKGQKMQVNYSGDFVINQPVFVYDPALSYEWARTANNKLYNSLLSAKFSEETIQLMKDNAAGLAPNNVELSGGIYGKHFEATNGSENRAETAYREYSLNMLHSVNIMGGTEKTTYYIGTSYTGKEGIYDSPVDESKKYSGIIKVNTDLTDWLSFRANVHYSRQDVLRPNYSDSKSTTNTDNQILSGGNLYYFPNVPTINPNGEYHWLSVIPVIRGETGNIDINQNDFFASGGFDFNPVKNLTFKGNFSYVDNTGLIQKNTKALIVEEVGTSRYSGRTAKYDEVEETMSKLFGSTIEMIGTYANKIEDHDFLLMAGFQQEERKYHELFASNRDVYTTDVMSLSTTYGNNIIADDEIWHWATRGYFFRASYNYKSKYLFDFNSRYDASSKYSPESRWAYFPSVSVGYNVAKEKFWPFEQVQMLKLTGSWGKLGDQTGGNYLYLPTMGSYAQTNYLINNTRPPYVTMPSLVSSELTWTKPRTIGFGVEASAFRNRLQAEYHWYQRTIFDQLGPAERYPETLGTNPPQQNNAISETRGWEVSLSWRDEIADVFGSPLHYEVRGNLSDYIGYVVEYEDNTSGLREGTWTPGQEFGVLWGYSGQDIITDASKLSEIVLTNSSWTYTGNTYIPDANGDGRITSGDGEYWYSMGDLTKLGYTYPRYKYAILLSAGWNAFDLSVLLDGVGKEVHFDDSGILIGSSRAKYDTHALAMHEELGYWSENNTGAFYPRIMQNEGAGLLATEKYLINTAHLRIKNVNLTYNCPKTIAEKAKLSYIKLNLSIENLGFIYNKSRLPMDPVQIRNSGSAYPVQRVFSLGVRLGI